jgi:peptidyl-prolyl cis-trans isomerase C
MVARGDGFEIDRATLDQSLVTIRGSAAGQGRSFSPAEQKRMEREVLRRLINIELLGMRATDDDRAKGREKAEERIQSLIDRAGSTNAMARQLKAVGLTEERLRVRLIEESTSEAVLERELNIEITDEQVKAFYDENPAEFEQPEKVRLAHILLLTRDPITRRELPPEEKEAKLRKIESLQKRARRGEDFAELAVEFSEDRTSRENGGEYTLSRGQVEGVPEFAAAAFSLSAGQVSDVITSQAGYHVVKVYEKIPAAMLELDEELTARIRQSLEGRELAKQMVPFMDALMKEYNVEILDDDLKPPPGDAVSPGANTGPSAQP